MVARGGGRRDTAVPGDGTKNSGVPRTPAHAVHDTGGPGRSPVDGHGRPGWRAPARRRANQGSGCLRKRAGWANLWRGMACDGGGGGGRRVLHGLPSPRPPRRPPFSSRPLSPATPPPRPFPYPSVLPAHAHTSRDPPPRGRPPPPRQRPPASATGPHRGPDAGRPRSPTRLSTTVPASVAVSPAAGVAYPRRGGADARNPWRGGGAGGGRRALYPAYDRVSRSVCTPGEASCAPAPALWPPPQKGRRGARCWRVGGKTTDWGGGPPRRGPRWLRVSRDRGDSAAKAPPAQCRVSKGGHGRGRLSIGGAPLAHPQSIEGVFARPRLAGVAPRETWGGGLEKVDAI